MTEVTRSGNVDWQRSGKALGSTHMSTKEKGMPWVCVGGRQEQTERTRMHKQHHGKQERNPVRYLRDLQAHR